MLAMAGARVPSVLPTMHATAGAGTAYYNKSTGARIAASEIEAINDASGSDEDYLDSETANAFILQPGNAVREPAAQTKYVDYALKYFVPMISQGQIKPPTGRTGGMPKISVSLFPPSFFIFRLSWLYLFV